MQPIKGRSSVGWLVVLLLSAVAAFPDQGKWDFIMNQDGTTVTVNKSMLVGSEIFVRITCASQGENLIVRIRSTLVETKCMPEHERYESIRKPVVHSPSEEHLCSNGNHIILLPQLVGSNEEPAITPAAPAEQQAAAAAVAIPVDAVEPAAAEARSKRAADSLQEVAVPEAVKKSNNPGASADKPVYTIVRDDIYLFTLEIVGTTAGDFTADVHIEMKSSHGFLSAADYPLLPFYGAMCLVYLGLGLIWLYVSFRQWRDLLRIQFWIGGVILLGMLEKAMFYAEYQSINTNGVSVRGAVLLAEWVSCAKRTLARMLVIIVSLGFGIVKPRLGPMLHRVVGTGALYFVLACVEGYLRVVHTKSTNNQMLVASIPLAVLDSAICWWIFTSLVQTTRTLRLRRNTVKLALYTHFTNMLIIAVVASVVFMLLSIKSHRLTDCLANWKELWQDEAFWHLLFSLLLLVIMILWRPTNNNQRYAFTPLLDNPEDEDEDDEEDQFVADAYGVKMRGQRSTSPKPASRATTNEEDDLRWVEENIPQAIVDAALPVLDSDEEIVNTKFEVSKMQ